MWRESIARHCEPETVPTVMPERCVHTQLMQASCQACVDACPLDAWALDDDSLGIDTALCDGCGLCASACPQGAILSQRVVSAMEQNRRRTALFACEMAGSDGHTGVIPCLHALGLTELLQLYRAGVRNLRISSGDCGSCIRGDTPRLWDLVGQLDALLTNRNLDSIRVCTIPYSQWRKESEAAALAPNGPLVSRRNFFLRAAQSSMVAAIDFSGFDREKACASPGKQLPRTRLDHIIPFVPEIDPAHCNGCHACARLCPQNAISLRMSAGHPQYRLDAEACTDCGICLDVCDQKAVSVGYLRPQRQFAMPLRTQRCRSCGASFETPVRQEDAGDLCFVCTRTNHARNLYQVQEQS